MSPAVPTPANDYLAARFKKIEADITALATTQNQYVLDNNSIMRVKVGWHQADNTYGVTIFDPSGARRVSHDRVVVQHVLVLLGG